MLADLESDPTLQWRLTLPSDATSPVTFTARLVTVTSMTISGMKALTTFFIRCQRMALRSPLGLSFRAGACRARCDRVTECDHRSIAVLISTSTAEILSNFLIGPSIWVLARLFKNAV